MDHLTPRGEQTETSVADRASLEASRDELVRNIQHIDAQLAERKAELDSYRSVCIDAGPETKSEFFAASNDFNRWRAKAIQAKRHRVAELARVKAKLRELNAQQVGSEDFRKYRDLRRAVQAHQAATLSGDYEPTPHDHLLWQAAYVEADPGEVA